MVDLQTSSIMVASAGVLIAALYYTFTLRSANRTRQAQLFMNIANQSFNNPEWMRAWKIINRYQWNSTKEFIELLNYPNESEFGDAYNTIGAFYEGLGVFVKEKLIDIRLVALLMTGFVKPYCEGVLPYLKEIRDSLKMPRFLSETEYLYNELMKHIEEHPEIKT